MASGAARPTSGRSDLSGADKGRSAKPRSNGRKIEYQTYIDGELQKTRSRVKWVDISVSLTLLAIGVLGYLLVAALVDHWLFSRGLGFFGRVAMCAGLVGGIAYHLVAKFAPLLLRKVNPVYAAEAIERGQPMKNTLINFLLLRKQPQGQTEQMLDAMKEQAAVRLSAVPADAPVDRSGLIRLGYVLCAVLIALTLYAFVGPKDTFRSVSRVVAPWADIAAPTRVRITELAPADTERRRDEFVDVKVRTRGMRAADQATIFFSPSGKPEDDVALPLKTDDQETFTATVPGGADGLKQDLYYFVRVGDVDSPRYRIRVAATPVISVANVRYEYPAYTELPPRDAGRQADLRGLEGSRVVITAETNQRIKSAYAAFDGSRQRDLEFAVDESGMRAVGSITLGLAKDRTTPTHRSYLLRFANIDGQENPKPIEHKIEVVADQPPEVKVTEPTTPETQTLQLPLGSPLRITLAARDPDFKLADVAVVFERLGGVPLAEEKLLIEKHRSEFSNTFIFEAGRYGLKVGDRVTFRGRATDNKAPQPNVAETPRHSVVITQGDAIPQQPPKADQRNPQQQQNGNPQQNQQQPQPAGQGKQGEPHQQNQPQQGNPENNSQQKPDANNQQGNPQPNGAKQDGNPQQQPNNGQQNQPNGRPQQGDNSQGQSQQGRPNEGQPQQGQPKQGDGQPQQGQPQQNQQGNSQPNNSQQGKSEEGNRGNDARSGGEPSGSKQGDQGNSKNGGGNDDKQIDPETNAPEALQALKDHFDKKDGKQPDPPKNAGGKQGDQNQQARNDQPRNHQDQNGGEQGRGGDQQGNQQPGMNQGSKPSDDPNKKNGNEKGPDQGSQQGSQPNSQNGTSEPSDPNGKGRNEGDKPKPGEKPQDKKNDGEGSAGAPSGAGQQNGNEPGKQGSDAASNGGASGQKSDRPSGSSGSPGGSEGTRTEQPSNGNNERRGGKNDGGNEVSRKPTDGTGSGDKRDVTGQKPADMSQAKPADQNDKSNGGQEAAKPSTDAPTSGTGSKPKEGGSEAAPKTGTANEGNPTPKRDGEQSNAGDGGRSGSASNKPDPKQGSESGKPKQGDQPQGAGQKPSDNAGDQASNQKNPGTPGGGSQVKEGTPQSQEMTKPREGKAPGSSESARPDEGKSDEGKSPAHGKNESDTQGDSSGDKKGQGEKGGGMKSNKEGTGASGKNTPADQGSGAANEEGDSVTGNKPGDKVRGQAPKSGNPNESQAGEKGDGNRTRAGGDKPGGDKRTPSGEGKPNDPTNRHSQPGAPGQSDNQAEGDGPRPAGKLNEGDPNGTRPRGAPSEREFTAQEADAANLEYTKKVTDLTLQRLKSELDKGQVDPELLKKFGSREALEQFANRYQEMLNRAKQAGTQGDTARKDLDEFYKGLGLRSGQVTQQGRKAGDDDSRDLRGAHRSEPPAKYADRYRAYTNFRDQAPAEPPAKQP